MFPVYCKRYKKGIQKEKTKEKPILEKEKKEKGKEDKRENQKTRKNQKQPVREGHLGQLVCARPSAKAGLFAARGRQI